MNLPPNRGEGNYTNSNFAVQFFFCAIEVRFTFKFSRQISRPSALNDTIGYFKNLRILKGFTKRLMGGGGVPRDKR